MMNESSLERKSSGMVHDLNNMLAVIKLYAQIGLKKQGLADELREGFEIIIDQVSQAKELAIQLEDLNAPDLQQRMSYLDEGYYWCSIDGILFEHNPAFNRIFGFEPGLSLIGTRLPDFWDDLADRQQYVTRLKEDGVVRHFELNARKVNGEKIILSANAHLLPGNHGKPAQIIGTITDITDRKRTEEEMRSSRERFRVLLSNLPGMAYRCLNAPGWPMEFVGEGCFPLTGYRPEELTGTGSINYEEVIHPNDRKGVDEGVQKGVNAGVPFTLEYRIITKKGEEKWVWERGQTISGPEDEIPRLEGFIMDISERRKAQEALRESEEKYAIAFNSSPYAISITRLNDGYIIDINNAFERITGYSRKEAISNSTVSLNLWVDPSDRNAVVSDLKSNIFVHNREHLFRHKNGNIIVGLYSAEIITVNNEPLILSSVNDITERKHTEDILQETREKLLSIFRVAPSGIGLVKDRVLIEVNQRICEMTGYRPEELIGQNSRILYPSQEAFEYVGKEKYRQINVKGLGIVETQWQKKNGVIIDILMASTPLIPGDNSRGVIFTALDITDRKLAEAEQKKLQDQLLQAQKMETLGRLAGGIAHEFNNNLQIMQTFTELSLLKVEKEHPIHPYLQQVLNSTRQSSVMVSQLLAFARKQAVSPEVINLNDLVEDMMMMLKKLVGESIELTWEPGAGLWPVRIDPSQVHQVLINLAINARDASSGEGRIIIRTGNESCGETHATDHEEHTPGDFVMLSITDNGCGMDKKTQEKIFEPFFTTKGKYKGTGLGLSTVYGIVKQNEGFIEVNSKPGKGSSFRLYFPKFQEA